MQGPKQRFGGAPLVLKWAQRGITLSMGEVFAGVRIIELAQFVFVPVAHPRRGAHRDEILTATGFEPEELKRLRAEAAIQ
jgi:hypothetical protein